MQKAKAGELIRLRAYELAKSGKYADWMSLEIALRNEGFREPRELLILACQVLQHELNEMCTQARQQNPLRATAI